MGAFPRCRPLVGGVIESLVHCTYCLSVLIEPMKGKEDPREIR